MNKPGMSNDHLVTAEMLQNLPEVVQRYLTYTGVVGKPWINTVHLRQAGRFRQGLDRPWMPVTAEQIFTTNPPGFVWNARFKVMGLPLMRARDIYKDGHGHMFGKLAGFFTVMNVRGEQLDQGALLRYLGEMVWFPTAFLGENITWQGLDDHTAQLTFSDYDKNVSARLSFDDAGQATSFIAQRYRETNGVFSLDPWSVPMTAYGLRAGLNIPIRGQAVWNLPSGDLSYYDWEIKEVKYNQPIESI